MPIENENAQELDQDFDPNAVADDGPEASVGEAGEDGTVEVRLPERTSRKDRRTGRFVKVAEERDNAKAELEALRREMAELRGAVTATRQTTSQQQTRTADPHDQRISGIRREMELIQRELGSGALEAQDQEKRRSRFYELDSEIQEVLQEKLISRAEARLQQQAPQAADYETQVLRSEFPDVTGHKSAMAYAYGEYQHMVEVLRQPADLNTSRKALAVAAEKFGLRRATMPPVSAAIQQRYGAVSAQAGAKGSSGSLKLSKEEQKLAMARWPELDEQQAFVKYATLMKNSD